MSALPLSPAAPVLVVVAPESLPFVCACGNFAGGDGFSQAPLVPGFAVCRSCGSTCPVRLVVVPSPF